VLSSTESLSDFASISPIPDTRRKKTDKKRRSRNDPPTTDEMEYAKHRLKVAKSIKAVGNNVRAPTLLELCREFGIPVELRSGKKNPTKAILLQALEEHWVCDTENTIFERELKVLGSVPARWVVVQMRVYQILWKDPFGDLSFLVTWFSLRYGKTRSVLSSRHSSLLLQHVSALKHEHPVPTSGARSAAYTSSSP
jgi:hypothetical protein